MRPRTLTWMLALGGVACSSPAPTTTETPEFASGTWETVFTPSGAYNSLSLIFTNGSVLGSARRYGFSSVLADSGMVSGQYDGTTVAFAIQYASGGVTTYIGRLEATGRIEGNWQNAPLDSGGPTTLNRAGP